MDLKKEAARVASTLIRNNSSVGLGDGTAIRFLADFIMEEMKKGLTLQLYTSSFTTLKFLQERGIHVEEFPVTGELDQYFDGCDQIDGQLNAFKSGAGIHTSEKLLASTAMEFYILADASKFTDRLQNNYPLVLEVLPPAVAIVRKKMKYLYKDISVTVRLEDGTGRPVVTRYGNHLLDCRFPVLPELSSLNTQCKMITGVVEISLFYGLVTGAIIASEQGVRQLVRIADVKTDNINQPL
jgi:ribose 5-phosphate isomerase A